LLMTDINVDVKKGQMIAIVGPTGAGKTTLVNLLMRFYGPDGGMIKIDGMNIRDMTRQGPAAPAGGGLPPGAAPETRAEA
ncbi:MAG: ATP-binding cassette domain-containing protein, partial [Succinivibrionaceae bacterium]|nr:ATP-binding cassette domain-containing protein [Succinivibrionaceae bacterium]